MKKFKIVFAIFAALLLCFSIFAYINKDKNKPYDGPVVNIYFFKGEGCPHCAAESVALDELANGEYKDKINVITYEVWHNEENFALLEKIAEAAGVEVEGVPFTVIGNGYSSGYSEEMLKYFKEAIDKEIKNGATFDIMDKIK